MLAVGAAVGTVAMRAAYSDGVSREKSVPMLLAKRPRRTARSPRILFCVR